MNFVKASLKYKQVTLSVLFLVFVFGVNSLLNMPRREDPKITIPGGLVMAWYPGATPEQVEDQVTKKLEQYLFQFEEVRKEKTYSTSKEGMVILHIWLKDNVNKPDIFWSKLRHQLIVIKATDLPKGVVGPIVNSDYGDTEAMIIGVMSNGADYNELKESTSKLEDKIRTITAASKIKRIGEQKEEIEINYNSEKLAQYGIDLSQIAKVLQAQNAIFPTGELLESDNKIPLSTSGYYTSEEDIKSQIIGASKNGALIRLGDAAKLERRYQDPDSKISVNGNPAILLCVQMHEGNNIVKFGRQVENAVAEVSKQLPSDVKLVTLVNQPLMVDKNVTKFMHEFLLAIIAVILVVFLMLPFSVAAVAATAIPMTISATFALLHIFGIELHQVSLATLIVVLGMVVDDAIVIADNYVELLDRGNDRWTAAWRSATDLVVPILTATITIIAAFVPMVILTGAIGEFIHALPITVAIALSSSFIVAMFLTPLLCFLFIKNGLHPSEEQGLSKRKRRTLLDVMQAAYNKSIDWSVKHTALVITGSLLTIILAGALFKAGVRHKFFPEAERNQFVIELWMPTGTELNKTAKAALKIEELIKSDKRVVDYATFTGQSAPRFYYNYSPEMPSANYAEILVNTTDEAATKEMYKELPTRLETLVPEGTPEVKLMQQGQPLKAPVEVRVIGEDHSVIKKIALQIQEIIRNTDGSRQTTLDSKEDYLGITIRPKAEAARLGFTTSNISQLVYSGFKGYPISTLYEGNNPVEIVMRLGKEFRRSDADLENIYLDSPVTGAKVPLRQIADLVPEWHPGQLTRRNGIPSITVQSETTRDVLPSELLKKIKPAIEKLNLPVGYHIEYGGEQANKTEVFSQMVFVILISLLAIFLVLMFQFRNLKEVGLVMFTIPLTAFGAVFGLWITGNDFGFTAFVGFISLSGIVVRNAIILIDHTNELLRQGKDIRTAAIDAGKRRMRPIFLTAMAAAIGVWPMILSGSPLWSPLASVIAFGVVWSMIMSTLTIPVLYIATVSSRNKKDLLTLTKE
jgi:multidrug efflux pump subunit AcrB